MIPSSLYCSACGASNATDRSLCFACEQPLQVTANDNATLLQGRYRILTQVGKGGFGAVYRAEDTQKYGDTVAVKQINLRGLTPQETIEATDAFNREVSLLSKLSHPNLPHIYDNFTDPEHWYLVMDFIEGETLETYLEAKGANYTASLDEVLTLGIQLCTVLDYLHTREPVIIFRDLKPANIMRTPTGKLYLIDFGIARSFKPGKLKDTIPFGSPGYAAPEQYGKAQTTPRADVYSLGALLHMLLTGDDPIDNPFHFAPLRIYGAPSLTDLDALIACMTHIDVNSRPTTIMEVKDELQRIVDMQASPRLWHPPIGQTLPTFPLTSDGSGQQQISISRSGQQQLLYVPTAQRKHLARRKFLVGGFAITGLTIIGASGIANIVSALHSPTNSRYEPGGTPPYHNGSLFGNTYTYTGHTGSVQDVVWSQSDRMVASAGDEGTIQIWTKDSVLSGDANASAYTNVYNVVVPATWLAWGNGANNNLLAYNSGKTITILEPIRGTSTLITPMLGNNGADVSIFMNAFAWSSSGDFIVFPTRLGLQIWDVAQEKVVKQIDFNLDQIPTGESITSLSWSSDNQYIAAGTTNSETIIWDVASGKITMQTTALGSTHVTWSPIGNWLATVNSDIVYLSNVTESGFAVTRTYNVMPFDVTALSWSPDSQHIVLSGQSSDVHVDVNICMWSPILEVRAGTNEANNGRINAIPFDTSAVPIHSLEWFTADDGTYLAIGADKAYLLEINPAMLNDQGQHRG